MDEGEGVAVLTGLKEGAARKNAALMIMAVSTIRKTFCVFSIYKSPGIIY
jgi:hypothetical protein